MEFIACSKCKVVIWSPGGEPKNKTPPPLLSTWERKRRNRKCAVAIYKGVDRIEIVRVVLKERGDEKLKEAALIARMADKP